MHSYMMGNLLDQYSYWSVFTDQAAALQKSCSNLSQAKMLEILLVVCILSIHSSEDDDDHSTSNTLLVEVNDGYEHFISYCNIEVCHVSVHCPPLQEPHS